METTMHFSILKLGMTHHVYKQPGPLHPQIPTASKCQFRMVLEKKKPAIVHLQRSKSADYLIGYKVAALKADHSLAYNHFLFEKTFLLSVFWEHQWTAGHISELEMKGSPHNKGSRFVSLPGLVPWA